MIDDRDDEETTILATYTTRRDAEVAREYLDDAGIRTFVQSDDAGGMHPQMQRPHGVKLVGMRGTAREARSLLETAGFLPDDGHPPEPPPEAHSSAEAAEGLTFSLSGPAGFLGMVALLILLFLFLLS